MTKQSIVVPPGTKIYCAYVESLHHKSNGMPPLGKTVTGTTQIGIDGFIPIDIAKPVYIIQLDDEGEPHD